MYARQPKNVTNLNFIEIRYIYKFPTCPFIYFEHIARLGFYLT